jgi:hypothetical protein
LRSARSGSPRGWTPSLSATVARQSCRLCSDMK